MKKIKKKATVSLVLCMIALLMIAYPLKADYDIYQNKKIELSKFNLEEENESTLNMQTADLEVLGILYIPKIDVTLPVYKTKYDTEEESSDKMGRAENYGAALWYKLDDINIGKGTRGLLSSHNGLSIGDLFTHINKLTFDDKFYIKMKGSEEILTYKIFEIDKALVNSETVLRDTKIKDGIKRVYYDESGYKEQIIKEEDYEGFDKVYNEKSKKIKNVNNALYIDDNKELITLQTCTPIFINSHRLLVTGERIPYDGDEFKENYNIGLVQIVFYIIILLIILLIIKLPFNIINNIKFEKQREIQLNK